MGIILSRLWNTNNIDNINKIIVIEINDGVLNKEKLDSNDLNIIYKCLKRSKTDELQTLDYAIDNLNTKLIANKSTIENNLMSLENTLKGKYECSICYENPKEKMYIPCGQSFCRECAIKYSDKCPICRGSIQKIQSIY